MGETASRYTGPAVSAAEGWRASRLIPPSRLFGANGMTTGKDGRIYVAQVAGNQISAIDPDSGVIETISANGGPIVGPDDLAFDDEGNLYITEITANRVSVLQPNGTAQVIHGEMPVANPVTYSQGRVIAGELRMGGRIMELDRDGSDHRVILDNVPMPNAFQVGPDGLLYFPAQGANEIWRVGLDGGAPEVIARDLGGPDSVKFDSEGMIVSTQVGSGQVLRIDPRTGAKTVLADIGAGMDNCTFVGDRLFASNISGSIHEILAPGKTRPLVERGLQWPMGLAVMADGSVCVGDGMFSYALMPGAKPQTLGAVLRPGYPGFVRGVAVSGDEWVVTTANGTVARWRPAAMESDTLAVGLDQPMGVAMSGSAVVFAESGTGRVLTIEGGALSELASGLRRPAGVAVAANGTVYVAEAEAGRVVRIVGGRAESVLDGVGEPEGIAIAGDTLYIVDVAGKQLVACDLNGGARRVLAEHLPVGAPAGVVRQPVGGVGDMCGPMTSFAGVAAGADGTIYVSGDGEGSVLTLRRDTGA